MPGMNATTGRRLEGLAHLRQSVQDILTTPLGSRVMRRDYGALIPALIDQPLNDATLMRVYSAAVIALIRWEDRLAIQTITRTVSADHPGRLTLGIEGQTTEGDPVSLEVPIA